MADEAANDLPTWEAFLAKKKIDAAAFAAARPAEFAAYARQYAAQGPASFDHSAKFKFNDWRVDFPVLLAGGARQAPAVPPVSPETDPPHPGRGSRP